MTIEQIKASMSMSDVASMYGLKPNHSGFCKCPFHQGDNTASLKIYKKDFHCYGCGANGDIFAFVQMMDHCDFKTAYIKLGGTYKRKLKPSEKVALYRAKMAQKTAHNKKMRAEAERRFMLQKIDTLRAIIEKSEPMSDEWCQAKNDLQMALYRFEQANNMEPVKGDRYE